MSDFFFPRVGFKDEVTDSSGISVSNGSDFASSGSENHLGLLRHIAERHESNQEKNGKAQAFSEDKRYTPSFPRIGATTEVERKKERLKCDFRLSSFNKMQFPSLPPVPPTAAKYRHRVKIVPILNLPTPGPPCPPSPPPAAHYFLREQFIRERKQQSPGFSETDLARIFDHYSLSRYLSTKQSRQETTPNTPSRRSIGVTSKQSYPVADKFQWDATVERKTRKSPRLLWIPRLSSWIPEYQKSRLQYLKLGSGAPINIKVHPICSHHHDFYHHNLNWNARNWERSECSRFAHHHHNVITSSKKIILPSTKPRKSKKQPTIPKDPFSKKGQRNIKKTWLAKPLPEKEPAVTLVLPHETSDVSPYHWMIDNSTMTEDSFSDVFSLPVSVPTTPPSVPEVTKQPQQVKKHPRVLMLDKGCDVMSPVSLISRRNSDFTIDSESKAMTEETAESFPVTPVPESNTDLEIAPEFSEQPSLTNELLDAQAVDENDITEATVPEAQPKTDMIEDEISSPRDALGNDDTLTAGYDDCFVPFSNPKESIDDTKSEELVSNYESAESTVDSYVAVIASESDGCSETKEEEMQAIEPTQSSSERRLKHLPPPPRLRSPAVRHPEQPINKLNKTGRAIRRDSTARTKPAVVIPIPSFLERPGSAKSSKSGRTLITLHTPSPSSSQRSSKRRGKIMRDLAIAEEMRRAQLAEERKRKAKERFDKIKESRRVPPSKFVKADENFDADLFLEKYCIVNPAKLDLYKRAFDTLDIDEDGRLDSEEVLLAMQKLLPSDNFQDSHVDYILRLLELVNYDIFREEVDFKLFSIIVSLAQRILGLDEFMRGLIDRFDLQSLDSRLWKARQFFDYFVDDHEKQTISMENLWIELKAGGIDPRHEKQIRESLKHLPHLDVLDFITYLPLFTLTHSQVIINPLSDKRVL